MLATGIWFGELVWEIWNWALDPQVLASYVGWGLGLLAGVSEETLISFYGARRDTD